MRTYYISPEVRLQPRRQASQLTLVFTAFAVAALVLI